MGQIYINNQFQAGDSSPSSYDDGLKVGVSGDVISGEVENPSGVWFPLSPESNPGWGIPTWEFNDYFTSEASLEAEVPNGIYTFVVNSATSSATEQFLFTRPTGMPLTMPIGIVDGSTGIPTNLTIQWNAINDSNPNDIVEIEIDGPGTDIEGRQATTTTSYGPVTLDPSTNYTLYLFVDSESEYTNADGVDFSSDASNETVGIPFTTAGPEVGPAAQLAFAAVPPSGDIAGLSTSATVDVEDSLGNIVSTDNSTVILALGSGPTGATLSGTTSIAAVNGVATFSNLIFNTGGSYTLTATDGSLTSATSSSFTISAPVASFATLANGALVVNGTSGDDTITLASDGTNVTASLNGTTSDPFAISSITSITVNGNAGNDSITVESNMPASLGVSGQGGPGDDTVMGGPGNDTLGGGLGNDSISGGPGDDSIKGGAGDDVLAGGKGNDTLFGSLGNDTLRGALGDDSLNGGAGTNQLYGGQGNNTFYCVNGAADQIFAGAATNDFLIYGSNDNYIIESGVIPPGNITLA